MKEKIVIECYQQDDKECYKLEHYKATEEGGFRYSKGVGDPKDDWITFKLKARLYLENNRGLYEFMYNGLSEELIHDFLQLMKVIR